MIKTSKMFFSVRVTFNLKSRWQHKHSLRDGAPGKGNRSCKNPKSGILYIFTGTKIDRVAGEKQARERELRNEVGDSGNDQGT